jgi:hypothetical protein
MQIARKGTAHMGFAPVAHLTSLRSLPMSTGIGRVARLADGTTGCEMRLMEDFEIVSSQPLVTAGDSSEPDANEYLFNAIYAGTYADGQRF